MQKGCFIGLSGRIGSGKSTVAQYLATKYGFTVLSFGQMLTGILQERNEPVSRENLQALGNELYDSLGPGGLTEMLIKDSDSDQNYVIDGIRHATIANFLKNKYGNCFTLLYLDAPTETRFTRLATAKRFNNSLSLEQFKATEQDPTEYDVIYKLKEKADFIVDCSKTQSLVYNQLDDILSRTKVKG